MPELAETYELTEFRRAFGNIEAVAPGICRRQSIHDDRFASSQIFFQFQRLHSTSDRKVGIRHDQHLGPIGDSRKCGQWLRRKSPHIGKRKQRGIRILLRSNQHYGAFDQITGQLANRRRIHTSVNDAPEDNQWPWEIAQQLTFRMWFFARG